ncbi:MAG: helix-turn-helix transcriptional regulator [Rhodobacteraceae bacterium]|nr:helix-turn-helix transcriptional regulator [Paracoccaceae bacterium]HEO70820.1 XRE family transcriptional regulator [Candidatus Hydrogenedentota bacterium]
MITARQIRAARVLLGWTQQTLADKACVALTALKRLESQSGVRTHESTQDRVHRALRAAGIEFIWGSKGVGVLLREIEEEDKTSQ